MTRTAIRHTLSALAAVVLVSAFATSPAWPGAREAAEAQKYAADQNAADGTPWATQIKKLKANVKER